MSVSFPDGPLPILQSPDIPNIRALQRALTPSPDFQKYTSYLPTVEPLSARAHFLSGTGTGAGAFLTALPDTSLPLFGPYFSTAFQVRLGINIANLAGIEFGEGSSCSAASHKDSGSSICGMPIDGPLLHSLTCGFGGGWYYSHNAVNRTLTNILGEVHGQKSCSDDHAEICSSFGSNPDRPRPAPPDGNSRSRQRDPNGIWTPDILV